VEVAVPKGTPGEILTTLAGTHHELVEVDVDGLLGEYLKGGLPATTMGRGVDEDRDFFLAGLAGGAALAKRIDGGAA
jgi:hypothetical protein